MTKEELKKQQQRVQEGFYQGARFGLAFRSVFWLTPMTVRSHGCSIAPRETHQRLMGDDEIERSGPLPASIRQRISAQRACTSAD
jgi:hypothetical protein